MKPRSVVVLMGCLAIVCVRLPGWQTAHGFIDTFRPETLAATCERAQSITVLRVARFDKDKHIILYDVVKNLKGEFPRDRLRQVAGDANEPHELKHLMQWVGKGKTAVAFRYENRVAICTGDQWSVGDQAPPEDKAEPYTLNGTRTEPWYNGVYFGDADKLVDAATDILAGKEVVVSLMLGERNKELRQRTGKLIRMRTSVKLKTYDLKRDTVEEDEPGPKNKATPSDREPLKNCVYRKGQTRIMPLGDSITNAAGWRVYLQDLLKKNGYTYRMVGGRNDPLLPDGYWSDHGGCGGWTIGSFPASQEFGGADVDWAGSRPDLVLLMIGTNDMQWGHREGAVDRLGRLLDRIWADVPDATILLAQITPFAPGSRVNDRKDGDPLDKEVEAYNQGIAKMAAERAKAGKRVVLVDQHTGFDPAKDLVDKCHPNEAGHRKMAQKWFEAIRAITAKDRDYPDRVLPPVVRVTNGDKAKVVPPGEKVRLTGMLTDAGGKDVKITYAWRKLCGPGDVAFDAADQLTATATFSKPGGYCVALTASNGKAEARSDVQVIVTKESEEGDQATPGEAGKVIGIAFGTALRPTDVAGVVPRSHWNTVKLRESTVAKANDLVDDGGGKTAASYRFWGNNAGPAENAGCPDSPDGRLLSGRYAGTNPVSHRIQNIPFAHYDLYLYFYQAVGKRSEDASFIHCFRVRDLETDQTILGPLYVKNMGGPFKKWVRAATNQTEDRKEATPAANYLLIPDLAAKDVEVLTAAGSSLCGIQIVERQATGK